MPCGGTLELVLEPLGAESGLDELLSRVERHELVVRRLDMESGRTEIEPGKWSDQLAFDGKTLSSCTVRTGACVHRSARGSFRSISRKWRRRSITT